MQLISIRWLIGNLRTKQIFITMVIDGDSAFDPGEL